ncbi:MAG: hypothetical protein ACXV3U_06490 [Halobacteriota archaeon]
MKSWTSLSAPNEHRTVMDDTSMETQSDSFVAQQLSLYKDEIGRTTADLLCEASERAFTHELWVLDDHFLARIDEVCERISQRATVYYGISKAENRSLLRELERYTKQFASSLDVLSAQFSGDVLVQRSSPRYHKSLVSVFNKLYEIDKKLLER